MILFKPEQVEPILVGRKTQTRRTWKRPRVKVGSVHQAKTTYHDKPFARIKITGLRRQRLGDISTEDVHREGYDSREQFFEVWRRIYGREPDLGQLVWVVDFERVN